MKNAASQAPALGGFGVAHTSGASEFATPEVSVRVARSRAEVEEIRDTWSAWPSHRDSDIDFCLDFFWTRPEVVRPHVIVVYRDRRPDAMLVGRLESTRITPKIGYLRLPGIPSRALSFSYEGLLGDPSAENCAEIVRSIMNSLRRREADVASLHQPRADSPIYQKALRMPKFSSRDHLAEPAPHHFMVLPDNIEQVYLGLSSGHRKHLRSEAKRLSTDFQGRVRVVCFREAAELDRAIPDVEAIAKGTYQRGLGVGFEDTPESRHLLHFFAEKDWLRIYVLYLGESETPAAFSIGSVSNGAYCCDFLGYDSRFRKYSAGTFLLTKMLEDFCRDGVKMVDFGGGGGDYKERFGNLRVMEASVYVFAPSIKGLALNAVRTSTGLIDNSIKGILERTALLATIKRFWRLRLAKKAAVKGASDSPKPVSKQ
jgi:hypothetical protein